MIKYLNNKEGFTLVEFLVAILITSVITTTIATYLVVHIRTFEFARDKSDVQYESQIVMNNIARLGRESMGISQVVGPTNNDIGTSTSVESEATAVKQFLVVLYEKEGTGITYHLFEVDANNVLYYYEEKTTTTTIKTFSLSDAVTLGQEFSDRIDKITFSTVDGEGFTNSDSLKIVAEIENGEVAHTAKTIVTFRNKK